MSCKIFRFKKISSDGQKVPFWKKLNPRIKEKNRMSPIQPKVGQDDVEWKIMNFFVYDELCNCNISGNEMLRRWEFSEFCNFRSTSPMILNLLLQEALTRYMNNLRMKKTCVCGLKQANFMHFSCAKELSCHKKAGNSHDSVLFHKSKVAWIW